MLKSIMCAAVGLIIGCSAYSPTFTIHAPTIEQPSRIIPVAIDNTFTPQEKVELEKAINDWNFALNGQIVLKIYTDHFDMEDTTISYIYNAKGVMLLKVNRVGTVMFNVDENTIAITSHIGTGHEIFFLKERANVERLRYVCLHELGHFLGSYHSNTGLMQSEYDRFQYSCIDYNAASQVAEYQHIAIDGMNWCVK